MRRCGLVLGVCMALTACGSDKNGHQTTGTGAAGASSAAGGQAGSGAAGGSGGASSGGASSGGATSGGAAGSGASSGGATSGGAAGAGGAGNCTPGEMKPCYEGPDGTQGVGPCKAGEHVCAADGQSFGACEGQVLPTKEVCNDVDDNCDGQIDENLRLDCTLNDCSPGFEFCEKGVWGDCKVPTVNIDPSPEATMPGEYGCAGCPDTGAAVFSQDLGTQTASTFSGTVTGAVGNGKLYIESAKGEQFLATVPTDPGTGAYSITAPLFCGAQTLKLVWNNAAGKYTLVESLMTSGCQSTDLRVTIAWDAIGLDWELHLIKQGGKINDNATDCTWTSCINQSPDWGVSGDPSDNPKKDVDNTGPFGPENIYLNKPEKMKYTVMVEHWGNGSPMSSGSAFVNIRGAVYEVDIKDFAPKHVWTVGTIEMPCGVFTPSQDVYDCSANWAGGCTASIP